MTEQELERLLKDAKKDQNLKQRLLKTRESDVIVDITPTKRG